MPMSVRPDALRQVAETFHRYPSLTALIGWYDDTLAEKTSCPITKISFTTMSINMPEMTRQRFGGLRSSTTNQFCGSRWIR